MAVAPCVTRSAQKDSRIKVIHKPNGGVSDARNFGVKAASGQFISFVDGDDYVHPEFIATRIHCVSKTSAGWHNAPLRP